MASIAVGEECAINDSRNGGFAFGESTELDYPKRQEALLHMDSICRIASDDLVKFCFAFGPFYAEHGRLEDAEKFYNTALAEYEKTLGPDHTSTLNTVINLGNLYAQRGRFADAEIMLLRALAGKEKALGTGHSSTLNAVHNLGCLYTDQGRLSDAEEMYQRALAGLKKILGPDHSSTLLTVAELGKLYAHQGCLAEAERITQALIMAHVDQGRLRPGWI